MYTLLFVDFNLRKDAARHISTKSRRDDTFAPSRFRVNSCNSWTKTSNLRAFVLSCLCFMLLAASCGGGGANKANTSSTTQTDVAEPATNTAQPVVSEATMTLTANGQQILFSLMGEGTATVDWGDGSEKETKMLPKDYGDGEGGNFYHSYSSATPRTITITGKNITHLHCAIQDFDMALTALEVSNNAALKVLNCHGNQLTRLYVSKNTALTELICFSNPLTALDVSHNTMLETLLCYSNQLTALDVSQNRALKYLHCYDNQLTALDVSNNPALIHLWCAFNRLTALDLSKNTTLTELSCHRNEIEADALNK